jgi:hypothetical protein
MSIGASLLLFVFGAMGFSANLFFRVIYLYEELQEGNHINWWQQAFFTFAVPGACLFAIVEILAIIGFFNQSPQFNFSTM